MACICKEVLINNEIWEIDFKTFKDAPMGRRFVFKMTCLSNKHKSLTVFNYWSRYQIYYDYMDTPFIYETTLEARMGVLKYFLNENI